MCLLGSAVLTLWAPEVVAGVIYESSLENVACDHQINDENINGSLWDTGQNSAGGSAFPFPYVRCDIATPAGSRYLQVNTICNVGYDANGRCNAASYPENVRENYVSTSAFIDVLIPSTPIVAGRTYYLGAFMRYQKVAGRDHWIETGNSWDKTLEFRGDGSPQTRWIIGVGSINGTYALNDGEFTFDIGCADTAFPGCQTSGNPDHKVQNDNGYGPSNPFRATYGRWYAVVMAVTMQTNATGIAQLYVNGTRILNRTTQVTYPAGTSIDHVEMYGTLSQTDYLRPESIVQMDNIILTDSLTDITNRGLMTDPQMPDTTAPAVPRNLSVQ